MPGNDKVFGKIVTYYPFAIGGSAGVLPATGSNDIAFVIFSIQRQEASLYTIHTTALFQWKNNVNRYISVLVLITKPKYHYEDVVIAQIDIIYFLTQVVKKSVSFLFSHLSPHTISPFRR